MFKRKKQTRNTIPHTKNIKKNTGNNRQIKRNSNQPKQQIQNIQHNTQTQNNKITNNVLLLWFYFCCVDKIGNKNYTKK